MTSAEALEGIRTLAQTLAQVDASLESAYASAVADDDRPALFKMRSEIIARMADLLKLVV